MVRAVVVCARQRVEIEFLTAEGSSPVEIHRCLRSMFGEVAIDCASVRCWVHNFKSSDKEIHWGDLGVDEWIIIGWISRRWDVGIWTGLGWPRIETGGGRL